MEDLLLFVLGVRLEFMGEGDWDYRGGIGEGVHGLDIILGVVFNYWVIMLYYYE